MFIVMEWSRTADDDQQQPQTSSTLEGSTQRKHFEYGSFDLYHSQSIVPRRMSSLSRVCRPTRFLFLLLADHDPIQSTPSIFESTTIMALAIFGNRCWSSQSDQVTRFFFFFDNDYHSHRHVASRTSPDWNCLDRVIDIGDTRTTRRPMDLQSFRSDQWGHGI